jgi:enoyl-CoA hydratase
VPETLIQDRDGRGFKHLIMDRGANALDLALVKEFRARISALVLGGAPPLILSSSHPRVFSPGWDLKELAAADRPRLAAFLRAFNGLVFDLFSYPAPTAVAINGHAVAGGCLLAMCCDLRAMATGRARLGLSEVNLGVPVPAACIRMLQARFAPPVMDDLIFAGSSYTAERALELGIVHTTASRFEVVAEVEREFAKLVSKPRSAVVGSKRFRLGRVWRDMEDFGQEADDVFLDAWFEDETQVRIRSLVQRLGR